jgi:hypothetical protein
MKHKNAPVVRSPLYLASGFVSIAILASLGACSCAVGRPVDPMDEDAGYDAGDTGVDTGMHDAGDAGDTGVVVIDYCGNGVIDTEELEVCDPDADASLAAELRCLCPDDGNPCTDDVWVDDPTKGECYGSCQHPTRSGFGVTHCNNNPAAPCHVYTLSGDPATCSITCTDVTPLTDSDCDDIDDDCDGTADDDYPNPVCNVGGGLQGPCNVSNSQCNSGVVSCPQVTFSTTETCNNVDDDCNNVVDNIVSSPCNVPGVYGRCIPSMTTCTGGNLLCPQTNFAITELCNNIDDDCNNVLDNNVPSTPCFVPLQQGVCANGMSQCSLGSTICPQSVFPTAETCNALDDDCNGIVNNGPTADGPGGGGACGTGIPGPCAAGVLECLATDTSPRCEQRVFPTNEICEVGGGIGTGDGVDNDCSGTPDINPYVNDGIPNTCATAGNKVVTVGVGGSTNVTGIVGVEGEDYFLVTFSGVTGGNTTYHPHINLTSPASGYTFSLYTSTNCATPTPGGGCGAAAGNTYTNWEASYSTNQAGCSSNAGGGFGATCNDSYARVTSMVVRVRRTSPTLSCSPWSITISN